MDGLFKDYLERHKNIGSSVHRIIMALKTVKLAELSGEVDRDMKSGLWSNESDMHIF